MTEENGFYLITKGLMICMIAGQIPIEDGKKIIRKIYKDWKKYYD